MHWHQKVIAEMQKVAGTLNAKVLVRPRCPGKRSKEVRAAAERYWAEMVTPLQERLAKTAGYAREDAEKHWKYARAWPRDKKALGRRPITANIYWPRPGWPENWPEGLLHHHREILRHGPKINVCPPKGDSK